MAYNALNRMDLLGPRMAEINNDPQGAVVIRNPRTGASVSLVACLGRTDGQEIIPGVAVTQIRYQDFLITSSDLDFGTGPEKPEIGWEIDRANGETYRVISLGTDSPPFEYTTASKQRMRIHAELIRKT